MSILMNTEKNHNFEGEIINNSLARPILTKTSEFQVDFELAKRVLDMNNKPGSKHFLTWDLQNLSPAEAGLIKYYFPVPTGTVALHFGVCKLKSD